jgi:hypothetical protein
VALFGGKAKPAKFSAPRPITAAAAPVRLRDKSELEKLRLRNATAHAWQREAWRVYDALGEVNFACNLVGNALSRVRIHAAVAVNPDEPPVEVTDGSSIEVDGTVLGAKGGIDPRLATRARELVAQLDKGQGIPSMLKAYALNQQVAGECYLTLINQKWSIKSTFELLVDPGATMRLQPSMTTQNALPEEIPAGSTVARMWTQHPMYSSDPDCQLRAVLFLCEQLILLNRMINNTVRSRMNAGILKVAASIVEASRTPGAEGNVDDDGVEELSPFETDLHAVMTQPIADDAAAGGVIPMVAIIPDDLVGPGIEHLQLARDIDEHLIAYADNVLTRILHGLAVPKDSVTGFTQVRFSNAQQTSEDLYTQAVEPLALSFVDAITEIFLRPILRADAVAKGWDPEEVEKVVVWYDPSDVVTRPDRGADADAGWDRGALSDDAWRQAHAFSADDAPSVEERLMRLLVQNPQLPPNLVDYLARELLPAYFKGAPPLVTKAQAGMNEAEAATSPLAKARAQQNGGGTVNQRPSQFPAGSQDQDVPPGGTLPPRTP